MDLELLNRIRSGDREAFVLLMQDYGADVYTGLLAKLHDRSLADAAFRETMIGFYTRLTESRGEDALAALLSSFADEVSRRMLADSLDSLIEQTARDAQTMQCENAVVQEACPAPAPKGEQLPLPAAECPEEKEEALPAAEEEMPTAQAAACSVEEKAGDAAGEEKERGVRGFVLILVLAFVLLWIAAGYLMSIDVLPEADLGYRWFNENIAQWF